MNNISTKSKTSENFWMFFLKPFIKKEGFPLFLKNPLYNTNLERGIIYGFNIKGNRKY